MDKQVFTLNAQQQYNNVWILKNIIQKLTDDPYWKNKDDDDNYTDGGKSNASNRLIAPVKREATRNKYPVLKAVFEAHVPHGNWAMTGEQWAWYLNHHKLFLNKFAPTPFEIRLEGRITLEDIAVVPIKEEPIKIKEPAPMPKIEDTIEVKAVDYSYRADDFAKTFDNIKQLHDWIMTYPASVIEMIMKK